MSWPVYSVKLIWKTLVNTALVWDSEETSVQISSLNESHGDQPEHLINTWGTLPVISYQWLGRINTYPAVDGILCGKLDDELATSLFFWRVQRPDPTDDFDTALVRRRTHGSPGQIRQFLLSYFLLSNYASISSTRTHQPGIIISSAQMTS
jgi:hypothetical protein